MAAEDRDPFAALNDDPAVMEHFPGHLTREASDAMADRIEAALAEHGWGLWAAEVLRTGDFIGFVGLSIPRFEAHFTPCVEIGWRLARSELGPRVRHRGSPRRAGPRVRPAPAHRGGGHDRPRQRPLPVGHAQLGMTRDEAADFDHPLVPEGDPNRRHVLYRIAREDWPDRPGRA